MHPCCSIWKWVSIDRWFGCCNNLVTLLSTSQAGLQEGCVNRLNLGRYGASWAFDESQVEVHLGVSGIRDPSKSVPSHCHQTPLSLITLYVTNAKGMHSLVLCKRSKKFMPMPPTHPTASAITIPSAKILQWSFQNRSLNHEIHHNSLSNVSNWIRPLH